MSAIARNISFLENDPLDTVISDTVDGRPLYSVKTPWKIIGRTTIVQRVSPAGEGPIIAKIHWHTWNSTKIVFMGTEMHMDDFLRKQSFLSDSRIITGYDGREYKWKVTSSKLKLVDCQTKTLVAESHRKKLGIFSQARKMNMDIYHQGVHSIDVIVVSFIVMEHKRRQSRAAASSSAAAASASASAASASAAAVAVSTSG